MDIGTERQAFGGEPSFREEEFPEGDAPARLTFANGGGYRLFVNFAVSPGIERDIKESGNLGIGASYAYELFDLERINFGLGRPGTYGLPGCAASHVFPVCWGSSWSWRGSNRR